MIFGMLPLGLALEKTGGVPLLANAIAKAAGSRGPHLVPPLISLLALGLTEVASSNAVGVLLAPNIQHLLTDHTIQARPPPMGRLRGAPT